MTLVEMLIATGILSLMLLTLGGIFVGTSRAYRASEEASDRQQEAETAAQLLRYEIGLAGYRTTDVDAYNANDFGGQSSLAITSGASDTVTVRYYEDRLYDGTGDNQLRTVTFSVEEDGGVKGLYRDDGAGGGAQIAVPGVVGLNVVGFVYHDGKPPAAPTATGFTAISGISVRLTFDDGRDGTILIGLDNPQVAPTYTVGSGA